MAIKRRVTISDIAKELNLSPSTVSTALTGRRNGVFVSADTRTRVVEAAERMGYPLSNLRAKQPKLQRIALLYKAHISKMHMGRDPVFAAMVLNLSDILNRQGYKVLVRTGHEQHEEHDIVQELHRRYEIDAAVFVGSRDWPELPSLLGIPIVVIGEVPEGMPVWRVSVDNYSASRMVGEHLWNLNHRRVGMVLPEAEGALTAKERLNGLKSVWEERAGGFPEECILPVGYLSEDDEFLGKLEAALANAEKTGGRLTGLFCYNDWVAGRVMDAVKRLGFRVPEDISVVGFDDSPYSRLLDPPLTTVHQPFSQLSALAAQLLLEYTHSPEDAPKTHIMAANLIVRRSTAQAGQ